MIGPVYLGSGPHEEPRQPDSNRRRRRFEPLPEESEENFAAEEPAETDEEPVSHISVEG